MTETITTVTPQDVADEYVRIVKGNTDAEYDAVSAVLDDEDGEVVYEIAMVVHDLLGLPGETGRPVPEKFWTELIYPAEKLVLVMLTTERNARVTPTDMPAEIAAAIGRAKFEIMADEFGRFSRSDISCFADLHDHVDANEYGGLCDPDTYPAFWEQLDGNDGVTPNDACNTVQDALNEWITSGQWLVDLDAPHAVQVEREFSHHAGHPGRFVAYVVTCRCGHRARVASRDIAAGLESAERHIAPYPNPADPFEGL